MDGRAGSAEWPVDGKFITERDCPVKIGNRNCLLHAEPVHPDGRKFARHSDATMFSGNSAYRNSGRVRRCLEENDDFLKLMFLPPHSPFLNPAEWLRRSGKTKMRRIFRRPARSHSRRRVVPVHGSLETTFDPRNTLSRDLGGMLPA